MTDIQIYRNILVAIDCSPVDEAILPHVSLLARQNRAVLHLLHVVHSHTLDQERVLRGECEQLMSDYFDRLKADGVEARLLIRSGEPDDEILKEIEGQDYDLVAMATHGHTILGDFLFGSVSRSLKHKISVPLLLIKPEK